MCSASPAPRPLVTLVVLACALSLAAGTGLARLVFPPVEAATPVRAGTAEVALVTKFYAAVNETLRTGRAGALDDLVAGDFVEHPRRPGSAPGRDGFVATLATLRIAFPALQITVDDVRAQDDHVAARVSWQGTAGSFLALPLGGAQIPWGPIDLFRVADGRIVEHWGVPPSAASFVPLTRGALSLSGDEPWRVTLARRNYPRNAFWSDEAATGPVLLLGQAGTVTVSLTRAAPAATVLVHHAEPGELNAGEPIGIDDVAIVVPGDLLVLPPGARFTTGNAEATPATLLVLKLTLSPESVRVPPGRPAALDGITAQPLVWGPGSSIPQDAVVHIGRMTLGPGAEIPLHRAASLELLLVDSGTLALTATEGLAWICRAGGGATEKQVSTLAAGDGALVSPGPTVGYRNAAATPVSVLVLTIGPAGSESGTPEVRTPIP